MLYGSRLMQSGCHDEHNQKKTHLVVSQQMDFVANVRNNTKNLDDKEQLGVLIQESEDNANITKGRKKRGSCCFHLVNELKRLQNDLSPVSEM